MATPHVAGVVALILDNNPDWTVDQVKEALYTTAIDLPGTGDGHGRVDAFAAVNYDFTTVSDTTPPVLTIPSDINTPTDPGLSTAVVSFSASANDDVDGPITPTCEPASGSVFLLGSTLVTCNATDTAGNSAEDSFTVTVEDKEAPLVIVPADITTDSDNSVVTFSVTADDNVDGALTPTCSPPSGTDFPIGETTVTCNATDTAGNTGVNSFTVTVTDNSAPTPTIHVGDLDYETSGKKNWKGKVTIFVHDENEGPIANALVQGVWNDAGVLISADCTTDNTGYCQVNESTRENLMIFTVTEVIAEGYDYLSSANHDDLSDNDDGNGTSITVEKGGSSGDSGGDSGGDNGGGVCAKNPEHKNC